MNKPPPPQTPQEAMRFVKDYLRSIAPPGFIDQHAFRLLGESSERVEEILHDLPGARATFTS